jgi:hypothetical protein
LNLQRHATDGVHHENRNLVSKYSFVTFVITVEAVNQRNQQNLAFTLSSEHLQQLFIVISATTGVSVSGVNPSISKLSMNLIHH